MKTGHVFFGFFFFLVILFFVFEMESQPKGELDRQIARAIINREYLPTLSNLIDNARKEISILHFTMNEDGVVDGIIHRLIRATRSGVKVRIILEDSLDENRRMVKRLEENGISVRLDGSTYFNHAKVVLVDDALLLGSTNLTFKSIEENNETNILIMEKGVVEVVKAYFEKIWKEPDTIPLFGDGGKEGFKMFTGREYPSVAGGLIKDVKREILLLLYGLRIYEDDPKSPSTALAMKLGEMARKGVDVRVILEKSDYNRKLNLINLRSIEFLRRSGVKVCLDKREKITHAKLLIVDDRAIIGSSNWSYGSFNFYREANVLIENPGIVRRFRDYFQQVAEEADCSIQWGRDRKKDRK